MRVIITGGTGLIGSALAEDLAKDGHEVIVLSRSPGSHDLPPGVRAEKWDGKTAVSWGHLADGADAIINLAGENLAGKGLFPTRWTDKRKERIVRSRLDAGQAVVEAVEAASQKPRVVIQSSGTDHYKDVGDEFITEASAPGRHSFLANLTIDWEASTEPVIAAGVRQIVIRSGAVFSPKSGAFRTLVFPFKFFVGGPLGNGRQWLSWIHLEDEVRAIRFLLAHETAVGAFNLCAPQPITNGALAKLIGKVMGRPSFIPVPAFALRLAFGEVADVVLDSRRVLPQRLQELGFSFRYPDPETAVRDLLDKPANGPSQS
ncbi:MAG: TIGR01777 family protein [Ardenticatenaceae bacterium]|nr:TIGR01777 family protein [Ardenticatenaceae bacterium]